MAPDPIDITDEVEPTERMVELQEQAHDRAQHKNTLRDDVRGSMTTDDYSISEAIERL